MTSRATHGSGTRAYTAPILSRKPLVWKGGAAESIIRNTDADVEFRFSSDRHAIYFTFHTVTTGETFYDGRAMEIDPIPHVGIYPAGGELRGSCKSDNSRYLALFLDPGFLLRGIGLDHLRGYTLVPSRLAGDSLSWSLADTIKAECEAGAPAGLLYSETAATMLSVHLLRHHSNFDPRRIPPSRGGLAAHQLRRVQDYIEDRIAEELSLAELLALVDLSAHHFCRAFKQSAGLPPHRWQVHRRVKRAQGLMLAGDLSLAEIAVACGFSDQSHFTTVFRKAVGVTPNAWRRSARQ